MSKKRGLGKGLGQLLEEAEQKISEEIAVTDITPNRWQPRRTFDSEALEALIASIQDHGIVQPIIVRKKKNGGYELVAGERRLRAAEQAGFTTVPAIIREYSDEETAQITLIENVQREDLNPLEEGLAYRKLMDEYHMKQEDMASLVGKSRSYVANMVRLPDLPEEVQVFLEDKKMTAGQARPLLGIEVPAIQLKLARRIVEEGLSARRVEELIRNMKDEKPKASTKEDPATTVYFRNLEEELRLLVGTKVTIKTGRGASSHRGTVTLAFKNDEEFERLMRVLGKKGDER